MYCWPSTTVCPQLTRSHGHDHQGVWHVRIAPVRGARFGQPVQVRDGRRVPRCVLLALNFCLPSTTVCPQLTDEFQDCNTSQCDLLLSLLTAAGHSNVVACGDDRQSIFGFRGGHHGPGVFQWLVDTYPGEAEITTLVTSHRCRYSPVFSVPLFFLAPLRAFFN